MNFKSSSAVCSQKLQKDRKRHKIICSERLAKLLFFPLWLLGVHIAVLLVTDYCIVYGTLRITSFMYLNTSLKINRNYSYTLKELKKAIIKEAFLIFFFNVPDSGIHHALQFLCITWGQSSSPINQYEKLTYYIGILGHKEGQVTDSFLNYFCSA